MSSESLPARSQDFIRELGAIALGSRLKRLTDRIMSDGAQVYRDFALDFEPRWFPLYRLLLARGPLTVVAASEALGTTHASVSQIAKSMSEHGILSITKDAKDERKRILELTDEGRALTEKLTPAWADLEVALRELAGVSGIDILTAIDGIEAALDAKSFRDRTVAKRRERLSREVRIVDFAPELRDHFRRLNYEWIEKYFVVEQPDRDVLEHPEREILEPGGAIYFATIGEAVVGTCALAVIDDETLELTKMGVTEGYRGRHIGRRLIEHAITEAKKRVPVLMLITNSSLVPAVTLYRSMGFHVTHSGPHPKYERGDLVMELRLR